MKKTKNIAIKQNSSEKGIDLKTNEKEVNNTYNKNGLTSVEVEQRIKQGKTNKLCTKTSKTYLQIFVGNIFTWFNLICFLIAGVLIAVNSWENILFLVIFLCNLLIGIVQEIKAKNIVDKISVFISKKVEVLRDGKKQKVDIEQVVEGDVLFFYSGDQICCDCEVVEGSLEANESLLTGESKPVKKQEKSFLYGGSFVVSGWCMAVATKVGMESYSSTLIKKARVLKKNKSDILKTLNFIIKVIGFLLLPLGILTYIDLSSSGWQVRDAIIKTSGSIIGMMPVGMFLLTSVSLVVGVIKLAKHKTLVQDLYSVEMLARANVLCLDKTGTITDGTMKTVNVIAFDETTENVKQIMAKYIWATKANNQTQKALKDYFGEDKNFKATKTIEFSSERKFSAVMFDKNIVYMLGAPEFVCKNTTKEQQKMVEDFTSKGFRVVLLCKSKEAIKDDKISNNSTPVALIVLQDNIREDAEETIKWFNENDVQIKIISGDNVDTVCNISKKVGVRNAEKCISLYGKTDEEVKAAATKYNVFGRVSPEQKCLLVKALRESGLRVAMTGDGVNDILALKEADCSIAMASGSEATRSASNLVMLNDKFSAMPKIVAEGRRVINNISKSSSLFLTKTFFMMFLTIFVLISPNVQFPLQPNQILLWESLFLGFPAFLLALQENNDRVKGSFIGSLTSKALPGALVLFLASIGCYVFLAKTNNMQAIATLISYTVTFGAFFILLVLCLPLDLFRGAVAFGSLIICLLAFWIIPKEFFNYVTLAKTEYIFIVCALVAICALYVLLKSAFEKIFENKKRSKKVSA